VTDVAAVRDARLARSQWVSEIARRGREDPSERFANLSARQLRRRLAQEAARYDFTVKKIQLLHPRQAAPLIVITTRHYVALAQLDPADLAGQGLRQVVDELDAPRVRVLR